MRPRDTMRPTGDRMPRARAGSLGLAAVPFLLGGLLAAPAELGAQACVGDPARQGEGTLSGTVLFDGGPDTYGGEVRGNLAGPLALGGAFMVTDLRGLEEDIYTFAGSVAYDLAIDVPEVALCPLAGVQYSRWDEELGGVQADRSEFRFPVGFGLGAELGDRESAALVPAISGGWFYYNRRGSVDVGDDDIIDDDFRQDETGGALFGELSAALVMGPVFVRAGVLTDEFREDDPLLRGSLGVRF